MERRDVREEGVVGVVQTAGGGCGERGQGREGGC